MRIRVSRRTRCPVGAAVVGFLLSVVAAPLSLGSTSAGAANGSVPTPSVEGPILPGTGISFLGSTLFPPARSATSSPSSSSQVPRPRTRAHPARKSGDWHVSPHDCAVQDPDRRVPAHRS